MEKELWKGNEAIAEAAIRAGCDCFFGYPITPQSEVPEYMSAHLPKAGGVFLQSESEVAAINMVYGAAGAGMRAMTSSSSPGISLKQEGITYIAGAELPCVIVNCMRGGPGLGTIQPGQGDYYQATRGGGNGDYRTLVLSPSNVQEAVDFVQEAFDIADQYRNPVMVVMDGLIGQMMEPIEWRPVPKRDLPPKDWATTGRKDRDHNNIINSLYMDPEECDRHNDHLAEKYALMEKNEVRWSETECEDAEIVISICASDIEKNKIRGDLGITYDLDVIRLINIFRNFGLYVSSVVLTRYHDNTVAKAFQARLEGMGIKVYHHYAIEGYPSNTSFVVSPEGFGKNDYIETTRPLVVITAPGPGSGKMATCLSQLYHENLRGIKAGYAKFETQASCESGL